MTAGLRLGAPGVYRAPQLERDVDFAEVRLDVTGFVGVCLRGPVDHPVRVAGWSDFQRRFGGVTDPAGRLCPGQLPTAVQLYFAQGGAAAWITRVGPPQDTPTPPTPGDSVAATADIGGDMPAGQSFLPLGIPPATAGFRIGASDYLLTASDPGSWGNRLDIRLEFDDATRFTPLGQVDTAALVVPDVPALPPGSLLRMRGMGLPPAGSLHWVTSNSRATGDRTRRRQVAVEPPLPERCDVDDASVISATLVVVDTDPAFDRAERLTGLGLHPDHPRYLTRVLPDMSALVRPADEQTATIEPASALLPALPAVPVVSGVDRWAAIDRRSFFDDGPPDADLLDEEQIHRGVDAAGRVDEIGLLCVPDLSWTWQPTPQQTESAVPARYDPCGVLVTPASPAVPYQTSSEPGNRLDPADPDQRQELVQRQLRVVEVAQLRRRFVAMLDVPRGLPITEITRWRTAFDSSFAAAYHPWLGVAGLRPAAPAIFVAPSVFACGITAARERRLGLPWGPANEIATTVVTAADLVTDEIHDQLHEIGVNAFRSERDGFRLTAARTLATDPDYVQLSVRRVMTMIGLTLVRQAQSVVFEPNSAMIRTALSQALVQFLGALFRRGAFTGDTERDAFFVRCDETTNPPASLAQGRLIAEIGVAPAAPLEYLVLRIAQDTDGALRVEATGD
jgi:Bacteriophage tail sheath protein